jgi:hypothetical protein
VPYHQGMSLYDDMSLTPALLAELEKRRAAVEANPELGKPWREVLDNLSHSLQKQSFPESHNGESLSK